MIIIDLKFAIPSLVHQCQVNGGYRLLGQDNNLKNITYDLILDEDTHTYKVDGFEKDGVSDIISSANENSKWFTAESAERGSWFHDLLNSYDRLRIAGEEITFDNIHENLRAKAIQVVEAYYIWLNLQTTIKVDISPGSINYAGNKNFMLIEKSLYSKTWDFCGTPDRIINDGSNKIDCYCLYYTEKGFKLKPYKQGKADMNDFKILLGARNILKKWR